MDQPRQASSQGQQPINDWYPPDSRGWQLHSKRQFFFRDGKTISLADEVLPPEIPGNLRRQIKAEPFNHAEQYLYVDEQYQPVDNLGKRSNVQGGCTPAYLDQKFAERGAKNSVFAAQVYDSHKSAGKNTVTVQPSPVAQTLNDIQSRDHKTLRDAIKHSTPEAYKDKTDAYTLKHDRTGWNVQVDHNGKLQFKPVQFYATEAAAAERLQNSSSYLRSLRTYKRWCDKFSDKATEQGQLLESLAGLGNKDKIIELTSDSKNESVKKSVASLMLKESTMGAAGHNRELVSTYEHLIDDRDKEELSESARRIYKTAAHTLERESNGKNEYLEDYLPKRDYTTGNVANVTNQICHLASYGVLPASDKKRRAPISDEFAQLCKYMNATEGLDLNPAKCVPKLKEEFTLGQEVRKETFILFLDRSGNVLRYDDPGRLRHDTPVSCPQGFVERYGLSMADVLKGHETVAEKRSRTEYSNEEYAPSASMHDSAYDRQSSSGYSQPTTSYRHEVSQPAATYYGGGSETPQSYGSRYPSLSQEQPLSYDAQAAEQHRSLFPASGQTPQPQSYGTASTGSSLPQPLGPDAIPGAAAMAYATPGGAAYRQPGQGQSGSYSAGSMTSSHPTTQQSGGSAGQSYVSPSTYSVPASTLHTIYPHYPQTHSVAPASSSSYTTPGPPGGSNTPWSATAYSTSAIPITHTAAEQYPSGRQYASAAGLPSAAPGQFGGSGAASQGAPTHVEQQQSVYDPATGTVGTLGSSDYTPSQSGGMSGPYRDQWQTYGAQQPSQSSASTSSFQGFSNAPTYSGAPQGGFDSPLQPIQPPPAPSSTTQQIASDRARPSQERDAEEIRPHHHQQHHHHHHQQQQQQQQQRRRYRG
jgi:hypothetical protein